MCLTFLFVFYLFLSRDAFKERFDLDLNEEQKKGCGVDGRILLYINIIVGIARYTVFKVEPFTPKP